ncbi:hypothetical protein [Pyxidicoccus xibeiensis]|uniref:hypothetical protein n=1 Tax=Pyxidicoccus xibeiensis TaxID=2906759 RepID=UPI0020A7827F|nr:hypothetical protein [Pyxidicoccus xibeiensis]MCP3144310.1 hypothetical protein [Pyxidicoccus xibeiensis]
MPVLLLLVLTLAAGIAHAQGARSASSGCKEDYATCKEDCTIEYGGSGRTAAKLTRCFADCQENLDLCADRYSSLRGLPPGVAEDSRPARKPTGKNKKAKKDEEEDPFGDDEPAPRRNNNREEDPFGDERPANAKGGTDTRDAYRASESPREEIPPAPTPTPTPPPRPRGTSSRADAEQTVSEPPAGGSRRSGYRASDTEPEPEKPTGLEDLEPLDAKPSPEPGPVARSGTKPEPVKPEPEPVKPEPAVTASSDKKDPLLDDEKEPVVLPAAPPTKKPTTTTATPSSRPTVPPEPKKDISEWDPNGD